MLTSTDYAILEALSEDGCWLTGQVSKRVKISYGGTNRQRSAAVREWLLRLKAEGLVALGDDQKPDVWKRTPAGTTILQNRNP